MTEPEPQLPAEAQPEPTLEEIRAGLIRNRRYRDFQAALMAHLQETALLPGVTSRERHLVDAVLGANRVVISYHEEMEVLFRHLDAQAEELARLREGGAA
jgi:hypothetical protein